MNCIYRLCCLELERILLEEIKGKNTSDTQQVLNSAAFLFKNNIDLRKVFTDNFRYGSLVDLEEFLYCPNY